MKKLLVLLGFIAALAMAANSARATLPYYTNFFNIRDGADRGCNTKDQCSKGMVTWSVSEPYINLWLADAPVSYTTSLGEEISFQLFYKQRDTQPPYTNHFKKWYGRGNSLDGGTSGEPPDPPAPAPFVPSTGWNHNWFSYIRFSGRWYPAGEGLLGYTNIMQDFGAWTATLYVPGGGELDFSYGDVPVFGGNPNYPQITQCDLLPMNGNAQHIYPARTNDPALGPNVPFGGADVYGQIGFRLVHADGSVDLYGKVTDFYGIAATADVLWTEHIDPAGNATKFYYTNFVKDSRTIYLLRHVVDYDGKTNTLSYTTNQLLSRVDMPYGRFATFAYDHHGNLTNITDAISQESAIEYYSTTNRWPARVTTPYGVTEFEYHSLDDPMQEGVLVGNAGGTNRVNRALVVTHDDDSKEVFLYRFDSQSLGIPATADQLPASPIYEDSSWLDYGGGSGFNTNLWPFYTRSSFHWNRQQTGALGFTNLAVSEVLNFSTNEYKLATRTRWLASGDLFLSEIPSMKEEASPDGTQLGARLWFDYAGKPQPHFVGAFGASAVCQQLPDGATRYTLRTTDEAGRPTGFASSYEKPNGAITNRSVDFQYNSPYASEICSSNGTEISWSYWPVPMLYSVTGPESETLLSLSTAYESESVTNTRIANGVTYSFVMTHPKRRELDVTDAENQTATRWFNSRGQFTGARGINGVTLTNLYDGNGWLAKSINLSTQATNTLSFTNGLLNTHTNAAGLVRQFEWDDLERFYSVSFPDNTGYTNGWFKLHLASQTDRLGHSTLFLYDRLAQLTNVTDALSRVTHLTYCGCGSPDHVTDPANASTSYDHDYNGRLRYEIDTDNFTRTYHRNAIGQVTNLTDTAANSLFITYNHQGLVKQVNNLTGMLYRVVYDIRDRPIYLTNTYGAVITNSYDLLNRPLTRTLLNVGVASTETWTYTTNGLATYTDPEGRVTTYGYDSAGRMAAVTNANEEVVSATFNKLDLMLTLTDGRNKTTRWAYDIYGRMIAETNANNVLVRTNGYDPNGRLTNQWTAAKGKATFVYDAVGNLTAVRYPSFTNTYTYDPLNRLLTATSSSGTLTRTYTNLGAFQSALKTEDGPWADDTLTFYRTPNRNLDTLALLEPGAAVPRTWEFGYDGLNRLKTLESFAGTFTNVYTGAGGRLNRVNLPGGNWITNWFDPAGQLLGRWLKNSGGSTLDAYVYTHDLTGLRTNVLRSDGTYANYIYDLIGQLTNAVGREPGGALRRNENFSYDYDAAGNLATRVNATLTQAFSVDNANRLTSATRSGTLTAAGTANTLAQSVMVNEVGADLYTDDTFATTNGLTLADGNNELRFKATDASSQSLTITQIFNLPASVSYTHDLNGNLVSDGARGYDYDDADQLIRITTTNLWKSEFVYDAFGRRIMRKEFVWQSGAWSQVDEVRYVWLGMSVLQERDAANQVRVTYTGRLAREDATSTSFYFTDGNGNVSSLIDSSGNTKAKYRYDSFGNMISKSGPLADANLVRFSGKEYHANSGLYYYGFRFYAPNLQRWMNQDPIGIAGGLNLFRFVENDPINEEDPFGLTNQPGDFGWRCYSQPLSAMGLSTMPDAGIERLDIANLPQIDLDAQPPPPAPLTAFIRPTPNYHAQRTLLIGAPHLAGTAIGQQLAEMNADLLTAATPLPLLSKLRWPLGMGKQLPAAAPQLERALANNADELAKNLAQQCPAVAKTIPTPPNRIYSARELVRRSENPRFNNAPNPNHNFPESFNEQIFSGTRTVKSPNYVEYTSPGTLNGRTGTFEIGVRPSASGRTEVIVHRFFRPDP